MAVFCGSCGLKLTDGVKFCPECGAVIGASREIAAEPVLYLTVEPTMAEPDILKVRRDILANLGSDSKGILILMIVLFMFMLWENLIVGLILSPLLSMFAVIFVSSLERNRMLEKLRDEDKLLPDKRDNPQHLIRGRTG
jgi:hypothetical protein